jgi:hypothetical protein
LWDKGEEINSQESHKRLLFPPDGLLRFAKEPTTLQLDTSPEWLLWRKKCKHREKKCG